MTTTKSFEVSKSTVWEAWKSVKENHGAHGIDKQSIEDFEANLKDNLYKLWNRMSSGSYFPPSVRKVEIPKKDGGKRTLGIPTVADRIAQTTLKRMLEPQIEAIFHPDSYGYRPNKSALDAVGKTRERCWKFDWVIDLDIKGFFDNMNHELLMKALKKHTDCKWILLYIERWLKSPLEDIDGLRIERTKGTPQGGVISPLISNLFMHYAFDKWMEIHFPGVLFARYADDLVIHCISENQANIILSAVRKRLSECFLDLHPTKTKIIYCKDNQRNGTYKVTAFDFLGYTFRPRMVKTKYGNIMTSFTPAIGDKVRKIIQGRIRNWKIHLLSHAKIEEIACSINPVLRGWLNYYCKFYGSLAIHTISRAVNFALVRWARRKFKKLNRSYSRARDLIRRMQKQNSILFEHWKNAKGI
ncbi:group II intron reverse transcriptase/maturase [Silvanigrella paludirubra]|uniref:RNA-directed DNA polymerase n=1 Tax=Silvanigrella paludirubra TaxID=2499159 RepID=A0A6N6VXA4_9BACT|nr:group II intron reverse transcriptase/maturase [Silvanigrella paludirubra]KAB8039113.1 group II intron reverse transcriptase/maturase [Silvanigrella paludirubra]